MDRIAFGKFEPEPMVRAGAMLAAGHLTATVTSRRTGRHVTLRFRCARDDPGWPTVPFAEATHVFVEDFDGELLARYFPRDGVLMFDRRASDAARWSITASLRFLSGAMPQFEDAAELVAADFCGRCGRPLTDPTSVDRGFGPECWGEATRSRAVPATRPAATG